MISDVVARSVLMGSSLTTSFIWVIAA